MRLSVLALFIALPAAAYAAVSPVQRSPDSDPGCARPFGLCINAVCCGDLQCVDNVRLIAHSLLVKLGTELNAGLPSVRLRTRFQ
jgi:hypothetical protein